MFLNAKADWEVMVNHSSIISFFLVHWPVCLCKRWYMLIPPLVGCVLLRTHLAAVFFLFAGTVLALLGLFFGEDLKSFTLRLSP